MPGAPDVLMIVDAETATSQIVEQVLRACRRSGLTYRTRLITDLRRHDLGRETVPLFVRCSNPRLLGWSARLTAAGHPYLYYVDDNFWRLSGDAPLARYYRHSVVSATLDAGVRGARLVLVNSTQLAAFLEPLSSAVRVLPTFFDFAVIGDLAPGQRHAADEVRVGFAGSASRVDDLALVAAVVPTVLREYPEVVFEFAGVLPRGVTAGPRVRFFPYVDDYEAHLRFQASRGWDIGLAPLRDTEANRCKTNNKYREYGACGTVGIYSRIPPYVGSVVPDRTGRLVDDRPEDWHAALTFLLEHPEDRRRMADAAREDVRTNYSLAAATAQWSRVFQESAAALTAEPPRALPPLALRAWLTESLARARLFAYHLWNVLGEAGPAEAMRRMVSRIVRGRAA